MSRIFSASCTTKNPPYKEDGVRDMKLLAFGDIHGRSLAPLERFLADYRPDILVCTYDAESVPAIQDVMNLMEQQRQRGGRSIEVIADHEYGLYMNHPINSRIEGKTAEDLYEELLQDERVHAHIHRLVISSHEAGFQLSGSGGTFPGVAVHGGYVGELPYDRPNLEVDEETQKKFQEKWEAWYQHRVLWHRLKTPVQHVGNFREMQQRRYTLMIRGHDHEPSHATAEEDRVVIQGPLEDGVQIPLPFDHMHTITHGAYMHGWFITIDTEVPGKEVPVLKFHKLEFGQR